MNDKKIVVIVDDKGEVQIEAFGHKGGSCTKATNPLVKTLIGDAGTEYKKPAFYLNETVTKIRELE